MWKRSLFILFGTLYFPVCLAQFSPPGLGRTNIANWFAVGVKQRINKKETFSSATYLGVGSISDPDNYNPFENLSIYVVNEEITHRFKKRWQYSVATSYRWKNRYKVTWPYEPDVPEARQEIRVYSRFSYVDNFRGTAFSMTYRPEWRFFYNPDFSRSAEAVQFRSRVKGKLAYHINSLKTQKIIVTAEFLFAASNTHGWKKISYRESRLCLYYSVRIPEHNLTFNVGYMNDMLGKYHMMCAHYMAFDIVFNNPFEF